MNIKTKKDSIYILCAKNGKRIKRKVNAKTFIIKGIKFAIVGDSKTIFNITHVDTGMSIIYSDKQKELLEKIDDIVLKFENMPSYWLENAKKEFEKAEMEE